MKRAVDAGSLHVRLWVMVSGTNAERAQNLDKYKVIGYGHDMLTVRAIKECGDGALGSRGAWLLEPYSDKPDSVGLPRPAMQGLRGRSPGRQVGPRGACTSAAWSPDGRWMYFGAAVGGG